MSVRDRLELPSFNVIKCFLSAIYKFSYYARVFVRLGCKSLPGTDTSNKNINYGPKSFITLDPGFEKD